jgi:hypothetical protein
MQGMDTRPKVGYDGSKCDRIQDSPINTILRYLGYIIGVLVLFCFATARAQTAEESVAYMMFDYQLGGSLRGDPVREEYDFGHFHVIKKDNCRYIVEAGKPDSWSFKVFVDFSNLAEYKVEVGPEKILYIIASGRNLFTMLFHDKQSGRDEKREGDRWERGVAVHASVDRLKKAEAFFRSNFCKGRAF